MHLVNVSHIHAFLSHLFSSSSFIKYFLPHFSIDVRMLLLYVTSKNITLLLFCGETHWIMLVSVAVCPPKEPEWMRGLFNHSFEWCFVETQQNSTCTCLLLFLLTWLCKYILNSASCVYISAEPFQYFVMYLLSSFFGCGSYACFFCFVSSFFRAVLPLGHLPPLSHRRSFCFVRTQWPSGSGIRDHPLLHGLLKNPSLNAAWYVLVFLVESCFWDVVSTRSLCPRCASNLPRSCRVWARPCSAWKCGYNRKSSRKGASTPAPWKTQWLQG